MAVSMNELAVPGLAALIDGTGGIPRHIDDLWHRLVGRNSPVLLTPPLLQANRFALVLQLTETSPSGVIERWGCATLSIAKDSGMVAAGLIVPNRAGPPPTRLTRLVPGEPDAVSPLSPGVLRPGTPMRTHWSWAADLQVLGEGEIAFAFPETPQAPSPATARDLRAFAECVGERIARTVIAAWHPGIDRRSAVFQRQTATLSRAACAVLDARLSAAFSTFCGALDPTVLESLTQVPSPSWAQYNWLLAEGDLTQAARRRQALGIYPLLGHRLLDHSLTTVIDRGEPLNPALGQSLGCGRTALRALRDVGRDSYGVPLAGEMEEMLRALDACPANWRPVTADDWAAFRRLVRGFKDAPQWPGGAAARLDQLGPAWHAAARRFDAAALGDILDTGRALRSHLLQPVLHLAGERHSEQGRCPLPVGSVSAQAWLTTMEQTVLFSLPLRRQREIAQRWHRLMPALEEIKGLGDGLPLSWPPLTAPFQTPAGWQVVPLASQQALNDEARVMSHCVGTYGRLCSCGEQHVISIRSPDGIRQSTAALSITGTDIVVRQHRARRNGPPAAAAEAALTAYLEAIRSGQLDIDHAAIRQAAERARQIWERRDRQPSAVMMTSLSRVHALYRPLLPRAWRALDLDVLLTVSGALDAVDPVAERQAA